MRILSSFNSYLLPPPGAFDCKLEVAKVDDYKIPIHYGYLVGDNVVQMVHAMERVIMTDKLEDCFR